MRVVRKTKEAGEVRDLAGRVLLALYGLGRSGKTEAQMARYDLDAVFMYQAHKKDEEP